MTELKTDIISRQQIEEALSYDEYITLIEELLSVGKTTGENHSESMLHYTKMNAHRMKRLDKQIQLDDALIEKISELDRNLIWLVLTEAWCGDAAQLIPLMNRIANESPFITLKLLMRDENLDIMDQFLTNDRSRSIPKLICLEADSLEVIGDWGSRPKDADLLFDELRSDEELTYPVITERLQKWYADDRTRSAQQELLQLINQWV